MSQSTAILDAGDAPPFGAEQILSARMKGAHPSPTAAVSDEARRLRQEGKTIINLGEGELDFPTPQHIRHAAVKAIDNGETKYTAVAGTSQIKRAICRKFLRENDISFDPDNIIVTAGAKQAIYNAFQATLNADDEVIVPAPYWVSYPDMIALSGGSPVIAECSPSTGFKITPDQLSALITPRTKWLVLNSPSNPTGALYTIDELAALADVLRQHPHVQIIADDIYEHIVYEGVFVTLASVAPDLKERTLTVNGVSKCFSMTGWRVGYAGGPLWLIKALETLQSQSTSNASSISQAATVAALDGPMDFLQEWNTRLKLRRDMVLSAIAATNGILSAKTPSAAFYVYASCAGAIGKRTPDGTEIGSDVDMAKFLLKSAGVATIAGAAFGLSPYSRIAYAVDDAGLTSACGAIVDACRSLKMSREG